MLTGPISIPHVFNGKNRFFFMVNDEWYSRISFSNTARTQPTAARPGRRFQPIQETATGSVVPIYDPATGNPDGTGRTQFPGNVIPAGRIDPISLKFIQLFDAPAQNSPTQNNYTFLTHSRDTHDGFNVRGDFYQSAKSQFAFRFSNGLETNPTAGFTDGGRDSRQQYHHQLLPVHGLPHLDHLSHGRQRGHVWLHELLQLSRPVLAGSR